MQKYSHTSRRVQKELGGSAYALSERVTAIENEIGNAEYTGDSITDAISDAQSDITTLKGYIKTELKKFVFDAETATEQTLQAVLENSEVMEWLRGSHRKEWTEFSIAGVGNDTLNGTYSKTYDTKDYSGILEYKSMGFSGSTIRIASLSKLKADTSTGDLSYTTTSLDLTGSYSKIYITFRKGEL